MRAFTAAFLTTVAVVTLVGCDRAPPVGPIPTPADAPPVEGAAVFQEVGSWNDSQAAAVPPSFYFPDIMTAGCALFDYDQDDDLDLLLLGRGGDDTSESAPSRLRLLRQNAPGVFADVTASSGLELDGYAMGVAVGDANNDGLPDLYITCYGADRLFLNLGDGRFLDETDKSGIENIQWGTSASFVDYDRDGWLDLFVTNYVDFDASRRCIDARGVEDFCGPQVFPGTGDRLFRNLTGDAASGGAPADSSAVRFEDVSLASGIVLAKGAGLGVLCADFNGDRWPDIYVANDRTANFLWINRQDGSFVDEAVLRGCAFDTQGRGQASMGVALGDTNADSQPDLFITNFDSEVNALYLGQQPFGFLESAARAGLASGSIPKTGFGTALVDLDNDGDLDLLVANGRVKRRASETPLEASDGARFEAAFWSGYAEENQIFLNESGTFHEYRSREPFLSAIEISRGLAVGDIDNDGGMDALVTNIAGPARLYRNDAEKRGSWLLIRAVEPEYGGRDSYGAVVRVHAGGRTWERLIHANSSYLSAGDPRAHFGLGELTGIDRIDVLWPDGTDEAFPGGAVNTLRRLERGQGSPP